MWVLDHFGDLESDLSAIHRIDIDPWEGRWGGLSGPRFFRLANRIAAYKGVIRARLQVEAEREEKRNDGVTVVPLLPSMIGPDGTII
jgi:hypothetical protein